MILARCRQCGLVEEDPAITGNCPGCGFSYQWVYLADHETGEEQDDLGPVRGLALALTICAVFWAALFLLLT